MITRTSLRHPAVRARICLTMLAVIRSARYRGWGVRLMNPREAGGALQLAVIYDPKKGGWRFLNAKGADVTQAVRAALLEARQRHAQRRAA